MKTKHSCAYTTEACEIHLISDLCTGTHNAMTLRKSEWVGWGGAEHASFNAKSRFNADSIHVICIKATCWEPEHPALKRGVASKLRSRVRFGGGVMFQSSTAAARDRNTCGRWRPSGPQTGSWTERITNLWVLWGKTDTPGPERI